MPFVFSAIVAPINLGSTFIGGGQSTVVAGWGGTGPDGPPWPNTLQVLNVTTLTNLDCRARHSAENAAYIFDQKICAYANNAGVCFGEFFLIFFFPFSGRLNFGITSFKVIPAVRFLVEIQW